MKYVEEYVTLKLTAKKRTPIIIRTKGQTTTAITKAKKEAMPITKSILRRINRPHKEMVSRANNLSLRINNKVK